MDGLRLIQWYDWVMVGALALAIVMQVWAWIKYFEANNEPSSFAMFGLWRVSFLTGLFTLVMTVLVDAAWLTIALILNNFLN